MAQRRTGPERLSAFSDAVFAVIITVLVLELKPPSADTFSALLPLWPIGLSYAVSYLFIAIVWVNHHHLFTHADESTPRLVWSNFAHLFSVSLIPFTTEWIAESRWPPRRSRRMPRCSSSSTSPTSRCVGRRSIDPPGRTCRSECAG